jgi:hypothetical protein
MIVFSNISRNLKVVVTGFALFATVTFQASGQSAEQYPHSQDEIATGTNVGSVEWDNALAAYKSGKLDEAIRQFQDLVSLKPNDFSAKMMLADVLTRKLKPGVETPENLKIAQQAINLYLEVIASPGLEIRIPVPTMRALTVKAITQIARINFSINKLDESKAWQKRVLTEEPKNAEASFAVGVIDWMQAHQNTLKALKAAGLTDDGMGNAKAPAAVMEAIKTQNGPLVEEALLYLDQAIENRPNYVDAMHYLDLVYRSNADQDFGNEAARLDDLAKAEEWRNKAMEARKTNEAKKPVGAAAAKL